jgi:hypothetical protein
MFRRNKKKRKIVSSFNFNDTKESVGANKKQETDNEKVLLDNSTEEIVNYVGTEKYLKYLEKREELERRSCFDNSNKAHLPDFKIKGVYDKNNDCEQEEEHDDDYQGSSSGIAGALIGVLIATIIGTGVIVPVALESINETSIGTPIGVIVDFIPLVVGGIIFFGIVSMVSMRD